MNKEELTQFLELAKQNEANNNARAAAPRYEEILANTNPNEPDKVVQEIRLTAFERLTNLYTYRVSGKYEEGLAYSEQYEQEATVYHHQRTALYRIGIFTNYLGDNRRAIKCYRSVLELAEGEGDEPSLAQAYGAMASVYNSIGHFDEAEANFLKAIELLEKLEILDKRANSLNRLGLVYQQMGEMSKAIDAHEQYLDYFQSNQPEDIQSIATALNNLGENYQFIYDLSTAQHFLNRGLEMIKDKSFLTLSADMRRIMGITYLINGELDTSLEWLNEAMVFANESGNASIIAQALYSLALAEYEAGHNDVGLELSKKLIALAGVGRAKSHYASAIHILGVYYQNIGDAQTAEKYWQEAIYIAHEAKQRFLLWRIHASMAEIASTPDLAQVHLKIVADIIGHIMESLDDPGLEEKFRQAKPVQSILSQI